jgi:hypothetical protein
MHFSILQGGSITILNTKYATLSANTYDAPVSWNIKLVTTGTFQSPLCTCYVIYTLLGTLTRTASQSTILNRSSTHLHNLAL